MTYGRVADAMAAQVEQWRGCNDRRAIFLDCYLHMTRNMLAALEAGEFHDTAWVGALLQRFAGHYFAALHFYEQESAAAPAVWRITHDAAREPQTMTLQHLFLGVNAHINYDLVLTVVEMLAAEWPTMDEDARSRCRADYSHVNQVIAHTIDAVQDEVVEPATPPLKFLDDLLGPLDEWATEQVIVAWRDEVWRHAVAMLEAPTPAAREAQRRDVEAITLRRAQWIMGRFSA